MAHVADTAKLAALIRDLAERHGRPISISSETGLVRRSRKPAASASLREPEQAPVGNTPLQRGFGVNLLSDRIALGAIRINSGTAPLDGRSPYPDARMPKRDWRPLSGRERDLLFAARYRAKQAVNLLAADPGVLAFAHDLLLPILTPDPADDPAQIVASRRDAIGALRSRVMDAVRRCGIIASAAGPADLVIHRPGQPSTAYSYDDDVFMGLHIDNRQALPFDRRERSRVLAAWNFGFAERYLSFVNLDVHRMMELLAGAGLPPPDSVHELKNAFLEAFPHYPVLQARLLPGQGYLCNTQDMLHDGATNLRGMPDVALLTAFDIENAEPL